MIISQPSFSNAARRNEPACQLHIRTLLHWNFLVHSVAKNATEKDRLSSTSLQYCHSYGVLMNNDEADEGERKLSIFYWCRMNDNQNVWSVWQWVIGQSYAEYCSWRGDENAAEAVEEYVCDIVTSGHISRFHHRWWPGERTCWQ